MPLCTSHVGIVWDLGLWLIAGLLPTKTSRMLVYLFGMSLSFVWTCSQVFTTSLVSPLFIIIWHG